MKRLLVVTIAFFAVSTGEFVRAQTETSGTGVRKGDARSGDRSTNSGETHHAVDPEKWESEGYQITLWKLYHAMQPLLGQRWKESTIARDSDHWQEIAPTGYGENIRHTCVFRSRTGKLFSQDYEIRLLIDIDPKTELIRYIEPMIRMELPGPFSLEDLKRVFPEDDTDSLLFRFVRLFSFTIEVNHSAGVVRLEVDYRDLGNWNHEFNGNGFTIDATLAEEGAKPRTVSYIVGSGLDPFTDSYGKKRDMSFRSKNILVDPEWGPPCDADVSGARVFLKLYDGP